MNQILFEMYIGVITNFQKEPDYGHQIPHYKVFSRICFSNAATGSLVFYPLTGRTHQLRVHAAHPEGLGCPILGDELYGKKADRLYLHAEYIEFRHPIYGDILCIQKEADFHKKI